MSWLNWFSRPPVDRIDRTDRILHAMFATGKPDFRTLNKFVSKDVAHIVVGPNGIANGSVVGQLLERDGFLQLLNCLRMQGKGETTVDIEHLKNADNDGVKVDVRIVQKPDNPHHVGVYESNWGFTFFFSKQGILTAYTLITPPGVPLVEAHNYYSCWNRICDATSDFLQPLFRLRALAIVGLVFALLMLLPSQSKEALRVLMQNFVSEWASGHILASLAAPSARPRLLYVASFNRRSRLRIARIDDAAD